jgi:probable rRNA maturation factor
LKTPFNINFFVNDGVKNPLVSEEKYKTWLAGVARSEQKTIDEITYIFCDDDYLLDINIKYLGHDYYTDIITFPYKELDNIQSDLYISVDRVTENAIDFNESFEDELRRVMVHGLLHLIGYGDKTEAEIALMREKESFYMASFSV